MCVTSIPQNILKKKVLLTDVLTALVNELKIENKIKFCIGKNTFLTFK